MNERVCEVEGCVSLGRKYDRICAMHRKRMKVHGSYEPRTPLMLSPEERVWLQVDKTPTCWLWTGATPGGRYGVVHVNGRRLVVHRFIYEFLRGPVDPTLHLDHLCRVVTCVNPDHLEVVTPRENTLRGIGPTAINARKTHCKRGHELAGDNLGLKPPGHRYCRTCKKMTDACREVREARES